MTFEDEPPSSARDFLVPNFWNNYFQAKFYKPSKSPQSMNQTTPPNGNPFSVILTPEAYERYRQETCNLKNNNPYDAHNLHSTLEAIQVFYPLSQNGTPTTLTLDGHRLEQIPEERFNAFKGLVEKFYEKNPRLVQQRRTA